MARANKTGRNKANASSDLWHQRLGHPSNKVLSSLDSFKFDFGHTHSCDVCFRAKQTREVFHESFNKALAPFDLVHCDV